MIIFPELGRVGRLGNQLFQVASTFGIAARADTIPMFPDDWAYRSFFSLPDEWFAPHDQLAGLGKHATDFVPHIDPRARIYLQDLNLFADVMADVFELFRPSPDAIELLRPFQDFHLLPQPVLGVHVRRGDNVKDPGVPDKWRYYPVPGERFYLEGIAEYGYGSVACFSDDIAWCRERLPNLDYYHDGVVRPKEHEPAWHTAPVLDWIDLLLGSFCTAGHVIGNSTYGIWMALLAGDDHAIIPTPWYGPMLKYVNADLLFPPTWRKRHAHSVR